LNGWTATSMLRILNSPGVKICRYGDETEHLTGVIGLGISYARALHADCTQLTACVSAGQTNHQMAMPQVYPGMVEGVAEAIEVETVQRG
jgi:hypothetical protein